MRKFMISITHSGALASVLVSILVLGQSSALASNELKSVAISQPATIPEASLVQKYVSQGLFLKLGGQLIDLPEIREFYKLRNFRPIWISNGQLTKQSGLLQSSFISLSQHGLNPNEYWTPTIDNAIRVFSAQKTEAALITAELLMTESLLKAAQHLSNGRYDPDQIDADIKFKKKNLTLIDTLAISNALSEDGSKLPQILEGLSPQMPVYKDLVGALAELRDRKAKNLTYTKLKYPGVDLSPGYSYSTLVPQIRQALRDRGYSIATNGVLYDSELETAIQMFQTENALEVGSAIGPNSEFWRVLSFSLDQRIKQIEVNMEKLRWLPRNLEPRHIFVNTAFTEFHFMDNGQSVLEMRTVNGRPTWRTPTMRDLLVAVILNPTWTAPDSIVTQIKLPEILKDIGFLKKNRIKMKDKSSGEEIDPQSVDWKVEGVGIAKRALFVQEPGPNNSLGVVKFPLAINRDDIYMHDTNERDLFSRGMRQRSSGCIRLQKPVELANYLLRGTEYTPEKIDQLITKGTPDEVYETNQRINLAKDNWVPVYTIYLTVERSKSGRIRFATDYYGQDSRISQAVNQSSLVREGGLL